MTGAERVAELIPLRAENERLKDLVDDGLAAEGDVAHHLRAENGLMLILSWREAASTPTTKEKTARAALSEPQGAASYCEACGKKSPADLPGGCTVDD